MARTSYRSRTRRAKDLLVEVEALEADSRRVRDQFAFSRSAVEGQEYALLAQLTRAQECEEELADLMCTEETAFFTRAWGEAELHVAAIERRLRRIRRRL